MCKRLVYPIYAVVVLIMAAGIPAGAVVQIEVENYSFEIPDDGQKYDISVGTPSIVTGWARVDPITSAGREFGWTPTDGTATAFMGKDAVIYNLTDFLMMEGDQFELIFDARSTWHGDNLAAQLYYQDDEGNRVVFATKNIDLWNKSTMTTYILDSNSVGLVARDHKLGIQFAHTRVNSTDDNIWAGLDYIELFLLTPLMRAQSPFPEHESSYSNSSVALTWVSGPNVPSADSYNVYFSANWADVNDGAAAADKGSVTTPSCSVSDLANGVTYYWRIDTVVGAQTYRGNIWSFIVIPTLAYKPDPAANAEYVALDKVLSWGAGVSAVEGHVVFFGDSFDSINNAPTGISGAAPFRAYLANPADTNWAPEEAGITLEVSKTYYWRIDEVESTSTDPETIHKGEVWQFTTVPIKGLGSITREVWEDIEGTTVADLTSDPNFPDSPSYTEYLTSFEAPHMAISNYGSRLHGWLYVRNAGDYTFWIASGENSQLWFGTHPSTASIIAYVDSEEGRDGWTEPRQWDKYPEIQQSEPIHLDGDGSIYYVMVLHKKGWGYDNLSVAWMGPDSNGVQEVIPGTSLIPFDQVTLINAAGPNPNDNATDVRRDSVLSWVSGQYAAIHDVYFGSNFNDVNNADTSTAGIYKGSQSDTTYTPGILEFNTTYYWRIDEVNDAHPDKLWKGYVWSFTTGNFLVVDDFEDYNDVSNRIYDTWVDYYVNNTGMTVGHLDPPFAEQRIVRSGSQSMYMHYDNDGTINEGTNYERSGTLTFSEAECEWTDAQDWTREGVESLTLWFRGISASVGSFTPQGQAAGSPMVMTAAGSDIWDTADEFHFAYKQLTGAGSITARVDSLTNTNPWAKAGVMIRDSLAPGAANAMVIVSPGNRISFQRRTLADVETEEDLQDGPTAPYWVKLTRSGNTFTAQYSAAGSNWVDLGTSVTITMSATAYVGLALTSHEPDETCTAEFSNVTITGTVTGDWQSQDIGIKSNVPEPLYVVVEDNAGNSEVVKHPDPNATIIDTWTEWNIPLSDFTSVNLFDFSRIMKMSIGVGDSASTQPDGSGDLYIDDIRLYRPPPAE